MLIPAFSLAGLFNGIDEFVDKKKTELAQGLSVFGEELVNDARNEGSYKDRTGNLRASIGYTVTSGGKAVKSDFSGGANPKPEGIRKAKMTAAEALAEENPDSIVLVGVAGMEYAGEVESRNRTVLTAFIPPQREIKAFLKEAGLTE